MTEAPPRIKNDVSRCAPRRTSSSRDRGGRTFIHRVLIVGGGSIGERHLRCFSTTGRAEISLCDNRPKRLSEISADYPVSHAFADFDAIDLSEFDAAVVCVPAHLHVPFAQRLVDAGIHVLVEKPLTISSRHTKALIALAEKKSRFLQVSYQRNYYAEHTYARELIRKGVIGELRGMVSYVTQNWGGIRGWRLDPEVAPSADPANCISEVTRLNY